MAEWPSLWGSDIHVCNQPSKCWWRQSGIEAGLRRGNSTGRSRVNLAHITLASVTLVRISSRGNLFVRSGVDDFGIAGRRTWNTRKKQLAIVSA